MSCKKNLLSLASVEAAAAEDVPDSLSECLSQLLVNECGSSERLANGDSSDIGRSASDIARTAEDSTNDGSVSMGPSEEEERRQAPGACEPELVERCPTEQPSSQLGRIHSYPGLSLIHI